MYSTLLPIEAVKELNGVVIKEIFTNRMGRTSTGHIILMGVVLLVGTLNILYDKYWFYCPKSYSTYFGSFAIFAPMIPFYLLAVYTNVELRTAIQQSCRSISNRSTCIKWRKLLKNLFFNNATCFIAPITWLLVSFFRKDMFVCAVVGYVEKGNAELENKKDRAESISGFLGLILLSGLSLILVIMLVISTCCFKSRGNGNLTSLDTIYSLEAQLACKHFDEALKKMADDIAKKKVEKILDCECKLSSKDIEKMSFDNMMDARKRLIEVYPMLRIPDEYGEEMNSYSKGAKEEWKKGYENMKRFCDETSCRCTSFITEESENGRMSGLYNEKTPLIQ